jgi:hypothetical protein
MIVVEKFPISLTNGGAILSVGVNRPGFGPWSSVPASRIGTRLQPRKSWRYAANTRV